MDLKANSIELWPIEDIHPYEKNAKIHSPEQVETIKRQILKNGWTQPIVVQRATGSIIAGHGRRLAAIALGLHKVPVIAIEVDEKTAKEMRLADNQVASTDYDIKAIQEEIYSLKDLGVDLSDIGFSEKDLAFLNEEIVTYNDDAFIEDISAAVEKQKDDNIRKQDETDAQEAPLAKAFGFRRLTIGQGRKVRSFMSFVEMETGKKGADALLAYIDTLGV